MKAISDASFNILAANFEDKNRGQTPVSSSCEVKDAPVVEINSAEKSAEESSQAAAAPPAASSNAATTQPLFQDGYVHPTVSSFHYPEPIYRRRMLNIMDPIQPTWNLSQWIDQNTSKVLIVGLREGYRAFVEFCEKFRTLRSSEQSKEDSALESDWLSKSNDSVEAADGNISLLRDFFQYTIDYIREESKLSSSSTTASSGASKCTFDSFQREEVEVNHQVYS
jgi:hypothetical protein